MDKKELIEGTEVGKGVLVQGHDTKKYNVKVFAGMHDVYKLFFNDKHTTRISKIQLILAAIICCSQVIVLAVQKYVNDCGSGIWAPVITCLAAASVMWTNKKITYLRLHLTLVLHVFSIVGCTMLLIFVLACSIPELKWRLYSNFLAPDRDSYNYNSRYNDYNGYHSGNMTTTTTLKAGVVYYSKEYGPIGLPILALMLHIVIAFAGLGQLILSIMMTLMTGRAMFVGKSKLEDRVFAMEMAGSEDADGIITLSRNTHKEDPTTNGNMPPSYDKVLLQNPPPESLMV